MNAYDDFAPRGLEPFGAPANNNVINEGLTMFEEQLTELQNSIAAALVEKPLVVCTAAIDDAFDDAFGTGGRDSVLRDLFDCYWPFYDEVGEWVESFYRGVNAINDTGLWQGETASITLYGFIRREAGRAIYWGVKHIVSTLHYLKEVELEPEELDGLKAALDRLAAQWDIYDPDRETA